MKWSLLSFGAAVLFFIIYTIVSLGSVDALESIEPNPFLGLGLVFLSLAFVLEHPDTR